MKKIISAILALTLLAPALFGCEKNTEPAPWQTAEFESFNYNNVENAWYTNIEYAEENTVFFWDTPSAAIFPLFFFGGGYITSLNVFDGDKKHIFLRDNSRAKESLVGDFAIVDSVAYYTANQTLDDGIEDGTYLERINFYSYDRSEKKSEKIYSVDTYCVNSWMVCDDKLAYTTFEETPYIEDEDYTYELYVRDLTKEKTIDICDKAKSYSFVGGELRYITYEEKTFYLWKYDFDAKKSVQIGTFDGAMGMDDHLYEEELGYNFTQDKIIITGESRDYTRFYIYDIETGALTDHNLPEEVDSLVAGEAYAYAVCVNLDDMYGDYTDSPDNGIYKIDLTDGTYEKTSYEADGGTCIYVSSDDDEVYIEQYRDAGLSAAKTVYRYDAKNDKSVKLFAK